MPAVIFRPYHLTTRQAWHPYPSECRRAHRPCLLRFTSPDQSMLRLRTVLAGSTGSGSWASGEWRGVHCRCGRYVWRSDKGHTVCVDVWANQIRRARRVSMFWPTSIDLHSRTDALTRRDDQLCASIRYRQGLQAVRELCIVPEGITIGYSLTKHQYATLRQSPTRLKLIRCSPRSGDPHTRVSLPVAPVSSAWA